MPALQSQVLLTKPSLLGAVFPALSLQPLQASAGCLTTDSAPEPSWPHEEVRGLSLAVSAYSGEKAWRHGQRQADTNSVTASPGSHSSRGGWQVSLPTGWTCFSPQASAVALESAILWQVFRLLRLHGTLHFV